MKVICINKDLLDINVFEKNIEYEVEKVQQCINCKAYKVKGKNLFFPEFMFKKV